MLYQMTVAAFGEGQERDDDVYANGVMASPTLNRLLADGETDVADHKGRRPQGEPSAPPSLRLRI